MDADASGGINEKKTIFQKMKLIVI